MISLDKCNGTYNVLSPKISVPEKSNNINVKVFNIITDKHVAKIMSDYG